MKTNTFFIFWFVISAFAFSSLFTSVPAFLSDEAHARAKIKLVVLDKMPKGVSARHFSDLYPKLSHSFREAFSADGRFELVSTGEVDQAIKSAGIEKDKIDPDDLEKLREIGKLAGADVVFISYCYEMGGHGKPMHSNNVLSLIWVGTPDVVKLDKDYSHILSADYLESSDETGFKDLLIKAEPLLRAQ